MTRAAPFSTVARTRPPNECLTVRMRPDILPNRHWEVRSMESSNQLRALAHPVRLRILSLLTGADLTAADVARELGLTHANASYHLRFLLDAGEIVVSGEETIRGGRARRYRHHWRGEDRPPSAASADPGAAGLVVRAATQELQRRHRIRRRGVPGLVTDAELWVDAQTWERARAL